MTGFSAEWLALREAFDHAARAEALEAWDLRALATQLRGSAPALCVLDLACGTGANLRELAPRLGGVQRWLLVDHDPRLLAALPGTLATWAEQHGFALRGGTGALCIEGPDWQAQIQPLRIDLAQSLHTAPFAQARLVTGSALLDLVSADWIEALVGHARAAAAAMLFALSVEGPMRWEPGLVQDAEIHRLFAAHQLRDKGFGAALGCEAAAFAVDRQGTAGYAVAQMRSDWYIDARTGQPTAAAMLRAMIEGIAGAALEQAPAAGALVGTWRTQRLALADCSALYVGHVDALATLGR
jgi:SAM-dependent methyltransferase